jgi:hypothetical protein
MQAKFVLAALTFFASANTAIAQTETPRPQIMVVGTYHFRGGGSDYVNVDTDNHLSPRRQDEIAEVLDRLERFRPTKIVVELEPAHEAEFNARYQLYRAGAAQLGVNERDQIGMALAARLGHERLYAADYASNMDFDAMLNAAQAAGQAPLLAHFETAFDRIQSEQGALAQLSVRERLIVMNEPEAQTTHNIYMTMAQMGTREDPVGAREMGAWWTRNMIIFAQIAQIAEPGDRILVIYGQGHKFLLDQYFSQAEEFELVDPLDYLR